jgi:glycosyltransferase involved in cell wall biosynthesis
MVCIGALSPEKDVANAVRALAQLPERWHLLIAGDGPERAAVERLAASVAPGRVRLLGQIAAPSGLLAAADVLVVPSQTEGLPGVVIEAGLTGVPAVVTDVGFVRHLVEPEVSGAIVAPGDPDAVAAAVLASESRLEAMGAAAHTRLHQEYSLGSVAQRWYDLLAPLCALNQASPA